MGIVEGAMIAEYYDEEKDHDVVFIGDCEIYENFSPITLWEEYGKILKADKEKDEEYPVLERMEDLTLPFRYRLINGEPFRGNVSFFIPSP